LVVINTTTICDALTSGKAAGYSEVMVTIYITNSTSLEIPSLLWNPQENISESPIFVSLYIKSQIFKDP
jgi:hypothetical protein